MPEDKVICFSSLLQHGILYAVDGQVDIGSFLLSLPGFTLEYLEKTVQTIFVNGTAADGLNRPLECGGTLALSAAMPGLAGAIFRRQGLHRSLRSQTEMHPRVGPSCSGFITLKLFNSVAADRVYDLMSQGILIKSESLYNFAILRETLFQPPAQLTFEGNIFQYSEMLEALRRFHMLKLQFQLPVLSPSPKPN
jgi:hypothetical protein